MLNTYVFIGNEILIDAPGNSNKNKIKNDLVWDINEFLITRFDLYAVCFRNTSDKFLCRISPKFSKKYAEFQKLDDMFIQRTKLSSDEIFFYRGIMDPKRKMGEDVFREICCIENVDIEYVATEKNNQLKNVDITCKSRTTLNQWIASSFPVYVSLFGSKEMRIVINQSDLLGTIKKIVENHCVKKQL